MNYEVLGIMSGTSLDGLDLAWCSFRFDQEKWQFTLRSSTTITFPEDLKVQLQNGIYLPGLELTQLDHDWGHFCANAILQFMGEDIVKLDLIGSHGHTIFHQPENGFTLQIGNAQVIHQKTGIPTVADFRTLDVIKGGQGAPLVPTGECHLFKEYDACLNIGGISNISYIKREPPKAYDLGPANMLLNYICRKMGKEFDSGGEMASKGRFLPDVDAFLNKFPFYRAPAPKSLGFESISTYFFPFVDQFKGDWKDLLHTATLHMAQIIGQSINKELHAGKVLFSGGGTYNTFLVSEIEKIVGKEVKVDIPPRAIIEYKEAIIFGFLGLLRKNGQINIDANFTGASSNSSAGILYDK